MEETNAEPVEVNAAHPVDEDPEEHIGKPLQDPWDPANDTGWWNYDQVEEKKE